MLVLFHDRKCSNCINLFLCILWDFIVLSLVLNWWRIEHEMKISIVSRLSCEKFAKRVTREKEHIRSTCWKLKSQVPATFRECFVRQAISRGTRYMLCLEDFKYDFLTLHPYYVYHHYSQKYERQFREKNPR